MRNRVVMLDAGFEASLGIVLLLGAMIGDIDGTDFADPASTTVVVLFGAALLALGFGLAGLVSRDAVTRPVLLALAAGNAGFAVLFAIYALVGDGFSTEGRAIVWVTVVALVMLATLQAREIAAADRRAS